MNRIFLFLSLMLTLSATSQIVINEGSNKNYTTIADEDGEFEDWIELFNSGSTAVDLYNFNLTDDLNQPSMWTFPHYTLNPGEYLVVFCSEKNRFQTAPFTTVVTNNNFTPTTGWNQHNFTTPFIWDGVSNIVVNTCSYSNTGYIVNSQFNQTNQPYTATTFSYVDYSEAACSANNGGTSTWRPNIRLNNTTIGTGTLQNSPTDYPAPYGNWYWSARNQMLIRSEELIAAGLTAGPINSLSFSVAATDPILYTYVEIKMNHTSETQMTDVFLDSDGSQFHTNFKIGGNGETVYLIDNTGAVSDSLHVDCQALDISLGSYPDASEVISLFSIPTPSNTNANVANGYAAAPLFDLPSGVYNSMQNVSIYDPNNPTGTIRYTLDGSTPNQTSPIYTGQPIPIYQSRILRARVYLPNMIPSGPTTASYLFNVSHQTPIISVSTANNNLYGETGIFDHWDQDWLRDAHVDYFDSIPGHPLLFSTNSGMMVDGGAGGSRSHPQHSFRLEMANSVLGEQPIIYPIIPNRPTRNKYSDFYLRNGSNQYLVLPYKDACQVHLMCNGSNTYFSAWRPVTVYINGQYFGLYELREKYNKEMFKTLEDATNSTTEILSLSYWNGGVLRAVDGDVDNFWNSYNAFNALDQSNINFWDQADQFFDLTYYTDYIISESWMGNVDWPWNNIKIYRSDATNGRWRFATIDLELALQPNGWTDCNSDHIGHMFGSDTPYINVWKKSIQNTKYKNYFINRFADLMNTNYRDERIIAVENHFFNQTLVEMQNEYQRWGDPWNIPGQIDNFYNNHLTFQEQLLCRTGQVRNHIQNGFSLPQQVTVELDVFPIGAGKIKISTITPDEYPWQGVYFDGVPVKIEAIANSGYAFSHWENSALITDVNDSIWEDLITNDNALFKAFFVSTVGIEENDTEFSLYPNPTNDIIYISHPLIQSKQLQIKISDSQGRVIHKLNSISSSLVSVSVADLAEGVYLVEILENGARLHSQKFIKSN